jgi:hypothetical protein
MRVLVACEFSGIVRDAFIAKGHNAVSCDLLPSERPGPHIHGDVLEHLNDGWDLMIAHPPCTYLSYAGLRWFSRPGRAELREPAMAFFMALYNADIPRVCVENPKGYPMKVFRAADQVVEPFYFGHTERKRTYLWLRNLPMLNPTVALFNIGGPTLVEPNGKKRWFTDGSCSGADKWKKRSRTFQGIADAMANQWGAVAALSQGEK